MQNTGWAHHMPNYIDNGGIYAGQMIWKNLQYLIDAGNFLNEAEDFSWIHHTQGLWVRTEGGGYGEETRRD